MFAAAHGVNHGFGFILSVFENIYCTPNFRWRFTNEIVDLTRNAFIFFRSWEILIDGSNKSSYVQEEQYAK